MQNSVLQNAAIGLLITPEFIFASFAFFVVVMTTMLVLALRRSARQKKEIQYLEKINHSFYQQAIKRRGVEKPVTPTSAPIFAAAVPTGKNKSLDGISSFAQKTLEELISIEESLLALRELHQRKLIDSDVYVSESMKYAN